MGVIGAGVIGQQVMKILVYSRSRKQLSYLNIKFVSIEELLCNSDFLTIHCPLNRDTKYLIDKDKLKLMKSSAFIINTSRGQIIKETDLIEALQKGIIAGAGLDVQDPEPPELKNPLFSMDNVIFTPHIGWKCVESRQRLMDLLANNINSFIEGNPINVVNAVIN